MSVYLFMYMSDSHQIYHQRWAPANDDHCKFIQFFYPWDSEKQYVPNNNHVIDQILFKIVSTHVFTRSC